MLRITLRLTEAVVSRIFVFFISYVRVLLSNCGWERRAIAAGCGECLIFTFRATFSSLGKILRTARVTS